jgi:hypothetical protein
MRRNPRLLRRDRLSRENAHGPGMMVRVLATNIPCRSPRCHRRGSKGTWAHAVGFSRERSAGEDRRPRGIASDACRYAVKTQAARSPYQQTTRLAITRDCQLFSRSRGWRLTSTASDCPETRKRRSVIAGEKWVVPQFEIFASARVDEKLR